MYGHQYEELTLERYLLTLCSGPSHNYPSRRTMAPCTTSIYTYQRSRYISSNPIPRHKYTKLTKTPDQQGNIELMVKKYPNGKASSHLHSLVPGDTLTFAAAIKGESWTPNKHPQIYAIAGGAGITPIYQLVQGILNNPEDTTRIRLVFGVNTEQDLLLREELEGFKTRFPDRFDYLYTVSHPKEEAGSGNGEVRKGYVTEELLRGVVTADGDARVFVCGPPAMEEALAGSWGNEGILAKLGFRKDQVCKF
jgi:cytochrome-b5 reductase